MPAVNPIRDALESKLDELHSDMCFFRQYRTRDAVNMREYRIARVKYLKLLYVLSALDNERSQHS